MEKLDRNSNFKLFCEAISPNGTVVDGLNPCKVSYKGRNIYVYIKNLTPAQLTNNNPDVWRIQLPKRDDFEKIKDSDELFILLGYDSDGDVYATWNPYWVKQRLNVGESVSLYSRKSLQDETCVDETIRCATLNHDNVVVVFPRFKTKEYIDNIFEYFPEITEYKAVGSSLRKKCVSDNHSTEEINIDLITPELYQKIFPLMDCDEPDEIGALQILSDYYGDSLNDTMSFQDWINLLHVCFVKNKTNSDRFVEPVFSNDSNPGELLQGSDISVFLNGKGPLKKNALGQAVVKEYLICFPKTKYENLEATFPDSFLGPRWCGFKMLQNDILCARNYKNNRLKKKRHLIDENKVLESGDGVRFVVSNQWDYRNIPNLFPIIKKHGWSLTFLKDGKDISEIILAQQETGPIVEHFRADYGSIVAESAEVYTHQVGSQHKLPYYCNCFNKIGESLNQIPKTRSKLIMLLSMIEYVRTSNTIVSNKIPLLPTWEGVFLRYYHEYGTEQRRDSTAFSTPFILLGEEFFWRLIENEDCNIKSVRAIKTFQKLQEMYDGVEIDQELFELILDSDSCKQLKKHILGFLK